MSNELRKHLASQRKPVGEFQREDRYIVIKRSDLKKVPASYRSHLVDPMLSLLAHLPNRECLVIERDWPEYEPAWAAIEARMTGSVPQPPALGGEPEVTVYIKPSYIDHYGYKGGYIDFGYAGDLRKLLEHVESVLDEVPEGELIDRAHLAPLQAEIERLKYKAELYDEVWELAAGLGYMNVTTAVSELRKERDQLKARCDEQAKALASLISVARTVNRNAASETLLTGDDEPQYRQRKEWIEYLLETCAEAEALSRPAGVEQA